MTPLSLSAAMIIVAKRRTANATNDICTMIASIDKIKTLGEEAQRSLRAKYKQQTRLVPERLKRQTRLSAKTRTS